MTQAEQANKHVEKQNDVGYRQGNDGEFATQGGVKSTEGMVILQ